MRPAGQLALQQTEEEPLLGGRKTQASPSLQDECAPLPQRAPYSQGSLHMEGLEIRRKATRSKEQARSSRTDRSFALVVSHHSRFFASPAIATSEIPKFQLQKTRSAPRRFRSYALQKICCM